MAGVGDTGRESSGLTGSATQSFATPPFLAMAICIVSLPSLLHRTQERHKVEVLRQLCVFPFLHRN